MANTNQFEAAVKNGELAAVESVMDSTNDRFHDIIKTLTNAGCKRINNLTVKNVTILQDDPDDDYCRVTLVLRESIDGFVSDDGGNTYHKGKTNNVFTSTFALSGCLKEIPDLAWLGSYIVKNPSCLPLILCGAKVAIIAQEVAKDQKYINPFTTKADPEVTIFEHDTIIRHIIDIQLGRTGEKMADKIANKLLG